MNGNTQEYQEIFQALSDRFCDCGGYDYDDPEEMDETGSPWVSDNCVGISLDSAGNSSVTLRVPCRKEKAELWAWQTEEGGRKLSSGRLDMNWQRWDELKEAPNRAPYRIGGQAAAELEEQLLDRGENR